MRYLGVTFSLESRGSPGTSVWNEVAPRYLGVERSDERGAQRTVNPRRGRPEAVAFGPAEAQAAAVLRPPSDGRHTIDGVDEGEPVGHRRQERSETGELRLGLISDPPDSGAS